jgi:hypothetical protein
MLEMGLDNVHLEPTTVGRWVRGEAECRVESEVAGGVPLDVLAAGGSVSTPEGGILAEVIEVRSFEELAAAGGKARGKIVFYNRAMDPAALDTFGAYAAVAEQRSRGAVEAARAGGAAALVRSLTTSLDDFPHTGLMEYAPGVVRVPAACLSTRSADRLSDALKRDPGARVFLRLECEQLEPVVSHNVVGELAGTEKPEEIILLGGHLDSWDVGTGAHDDGAGCAHALEALRLLKETGLRPQRTVRAVMFMDEENGGTGGRDYARAEARRAEKHLAAVESDRGGFRPEGFGIGRDERQFKPFRKYEELMKRVGLCWLRPGGGGVDIGPLAAGGTLLIGLVPDCQRYFDYHHCGRDVLEAVHPRELELGAAAMALLAYVLAEDGV